MTDIPIVERLTRKAQMFPAQGGGSIGTDANGKTTSSSYITDDGMRLANPDGPEAAALLKECVEALEKCRTQFDFYVTAHMAKQDPDMDKAATNQEFVEMIDATLAAMTKGEE